MECVYGSVEEVERRDECCLLCPNCQKFIKRVKGTSKVEFEGILTKSGKLQSDNDPMEDNILEVDKYVKEVM